MRIRSPYQAYRKAIKEGWSQELEDIVANGKDLEVAIWFARFVKGANIKRLEDAIIRSGDTFFAFNFATGVKGANISDLVDFVLIKEPELVPQLFDERPDLKRKYELGEIRSIVRAALK